MKHIPLQISYMKTKSRFYLYFLGKVSVAHGEGVAYCWKRGMSTAKEKSKCNSLLLIRGGKCSLKIFKGLKSRPFADNLNFLGIYL